MELEDVFEKMANNALLTRQEKDFLRLKGREIQQRIAQTANYTDQNGNLKLTLPIRTLYSEALTINTASVTVEVPGGYSHLFLMGSGRTTSNNPSYPIQDVYAQFNGDTGNNYDWGSLRQGGTTVDAIQSLATSAVLVGAFSTDAADANRSGGFFSFIPNYGNTLWHKDVFTLRGAAHNGIFTRFTGGFWKSTAAIQKIKFYPDTGVGGNFSAGSLFTVIGVL